MTEHSPGCWKAQFEYYPNDGEDISAEVTDKNGNVIASRNEIIFEGEDDRRNRIEADFRLIAESPEMKDWLIEAMQLINEMATVFDDQDTICDVLVLQAKFDAINERLKGVDHDH